MKIHGLSLQLKKLGKQVINNFLTMKKFPRGKNTDIAEKVKRDDKVRIGEPVYKPW